MFISVQFHFQCKMVCCTSTSLFWKLFKWNFTLINVKNRILCHSAMYIVQFSISKFCFQEKLWITSNQLVRSDTKPEMLSPAFPLPPPHGLTRRRNAFRLRITKPKKLCCLQTNSSRTHCSQFLFFVTFPFCEMVRFFLPIIPFLFEKRWLFPMALMTDDGTQREDKTGGLFAIRLGTPSLSLIPFTLLCMIIVFMC